MMPLETIFKFFLYLVVILVVIGLILHFRSSIIKALDLCGIFPSYCEEEKCETIVSEEVEITSSTLRKYCKLCWSRTGEKGYDRDCICYVVKGRFVPTSFEEENCELLCDREVNSLTFTYDHLFKKVRIECLA